MKFYQTAIQKTTDEHIWTADNQGRQLLRDNLDCSEQNNAWMQIVLIKYLQKLLSLCCWHVTSAGCCENQPVLKPGTRAKTLLIPPSLSPSLHPSLNPSVRPTNLFFTHSLSFLSLLKTVHIGHFSMIIFIHLNNSTFTWFIIHYNLKLMICGWVTWVTWNTHN